jgi:CHAT domain-containing protein
MDKQQKGQVGIEQAGEQNAIRFVAEVMQLIAQTEGDRGQVYSFFQINLTCLNPELLTGLPVVFNDFVSNNQPEFIAAVFAMFGSLIQEFSQGNRMLNLELAIAAYDLALQVRTREAFPEQWATTQNNLANAYSERIRGEKADNLEKAIASYQLTLRVYTREAFPEQWATIQNNLAIAYRNRIRGERSDNLEKAIAASDLALQVRTREAFPKDWAMIQNNLAIAYNSRIQGERADNLEKAITAYQLVLQVYTREALPEDWARTQNNLACAYSDRIRGEKADNLEKAIAAYDLALQVRTREAFPEQWATTQNNLASAYRNRIRGKRADNLEKAIEVFQLALQVRTREAFPKDWAGTQNNLALAYHDRIRGERTDNLELAIAAYQLALQVYTREAFPEDWAMTQNNLANAYSYRIRGERTDNLERSIAAYQLALEVYTREAFPQDWAMTQNNVANVYRNSIRGERADNLEKAIMVYQLVLQVYTREAFPQDWARTQNNVASAYSDRIRGERADNLEKAIASYQLALQVRTREAFSEDWAVTQNNLAIAYNYRIRGERADNLEKAIAFSQRALQVYTSESFPNDCRRTARLLGDLHFEQQNWNATAQAYNTTLAAAELLYQNCIFLEGQAAELSENRDLHHCATYAHAKNNNLQTALLTLELGRARGLSDSLARDRANLDQLQSIRPDLVDRYQTLTQEIRNLEIQQRNPDTNHPDQLRQALTQTRQTLTETIATIQQVEGYETFLKAPTFEDITRALKPEQAIVYITTTPAGSLALILTPGTEIHPVWLNELTKESLGKLINDWFNAYSEQQRNYQTWLNTIEQGTATLWNGVMNAIIQKLTELHLPQAVLIPTGNLGLLPLHAAWTTDDTMPTGKRYALDTIHFTYAPNARSLREARELADRTPADSILAIENPTQDLANATREIESVLHCFGDRSTHLRHAQATQAAVLNALPQHTVLHCACHGTANLTAPLDSGLVMSDRLLTLRDIFALKLNQQDSGGIRLAILSACETGLSGTETIDEVISLPTGLLQAGVAGIAASLWSVADLSTMMLLTRFYDLWRKEDQEATLALRQAQQWVRDTTSQQKAKYFEKTSPDLFSFLILCKPDYFAHPFHWAAFTYTGV